MEPLGSARAVDRRHREPDKDRRPTGPRDRSAQRSAVSPLRRIRRCARNAAADGCANSFRRGPRGRTRHQVTQRAGGRLQVQPLQSRRRPAGLLPQRPLRRGGHRGATGRPADRPGRDAPAGKPVPINQSFADRHAVEPDRFRPAGAGPQLARRHRRTAGVQPRTGLSRDRNCRSLAESQVGIASNPVAHEFQGQQRGDHPADTAAWPSRLGRMGAALPS